MGENSIYWKSDEKKAQDLLPPPKYRTTETNDRTTCPVWTKRTQSLEVWTKDDETYHLAIDGSSIYDVQKICEVEF